MSTKYEDGYGFTAEVDGDGDLRVSINNESTCLIASSYSDDNEVKQLLAFLNENFGEVKAKTPVTIDGDTADWNTAALQAAAQHGRIAEFRYAKGDGSVIETRTLKPAEVKSVRGKLIVVGFDVDREDARAFRLDRIKGNVVVS